MSVYVYVYLLNCTQPRNPALSSLSFYATRTDPPKGEYVCACVVITFVLDDRLVDAPARFTQEEGHTAFLHLPFAVLVLPGAFYRAKD